LPISFLKHEIDNNQFCLIKQVILVIYLIYMLKKQQTLWEHSPTAAESIQAGGPDQWKKQQWQPLVAG